jgi:sporulation protein YabP
MSNIIIENRTRANVTGVLDVISFDEENIILDTELGTLILKGHDFRIHKLNVDIGEFIIEGDITSCVYSDEFAKSKGSFFSKIFK